jgi:hypothetical protein
MVNKKYVFVNPKKGKVAYEMKVPKHFIDEPIIKGGHGMEYQYLYSDSSMIYVSSDKQSATPNEENISNQDGAKSKRLMAWSENKDCVLEGENNGLYWKEKILEGEIKLGYKGVPKSKKELFDNAIQSFSKK